MLVAADKTRNLYSVDTDLYSKLLTDNVTKHYRHAPDHIYDDVNAEAKQIAEDLNIANRSETMARKDAYITLKDHKENFQQSTPCRLINPAKSDIGRVSKSIMERIVQTVRSELNINSWKNTTAVIEWFRRLENKSTCSFICFDIAEFYPSISEDLLGQALTFATQYTDITQQDKEIVMHSRKSLISTVIGSG